MPSGIAATALITSSLRTINAIASGETPTPEELTDALSQLNDLLENWSTQSLAVYMSQMETFATVAGTAAYTIGPTGTWVTTRPVFIDGDGICTFQGVDFPVEKIGQEQYNSIGLKTIQQPIVESYLYQNDFPNGRVFLYPTPSQIVSIGLNTQRVLSSVPTIATVLSLPPGYLLAIRYNLAVLLAPDYRKAVTPTVQSIATSSFAAIKRANKQKRVARFDAALQPGDPVTWQTGT